MSGYLQAILKDAGQLGFAFDGFDGNGHIRLRHEQVGARYSMAATPGDVRSYRNALSAMERLSGRRLPRANAGKYRYRRQPRLSTELSPAEVERSREVDDLVAEADLLQCRFAELVAAPSRAAAAEARSVLARHEHLRRLLAQCHRIIDPLT